jgi:hypothetical protein
MSIVTNLTAGALTHVEKCLVIAPGQTLGSFKLRTAAIKLAADTVTNSAASYRFRVIR